MYHDAVKQQTTVSEYTCTCTCTYIVHVCRSVYSPENFKFDVHTCAINSIFVLFYVVEHMIVVLHVAAYVHVFACTQYMHNMTT